MTHTELVVALATHANVTQSDVRDVLFQLPDIVAQALHVDGEVSIHGFGKFKSRDKPAREGRNPATGQPVQIAATRAASFSAASAFKKAVAA